MCKNSNHTKGYNNYGFTIVELLIVIVIVGILAAITIVSYTGITSKASLASVKSDLANAHKQLKLFQLENLSENYPDTVNCTGDTATNKCIKPNISTTYEYKSNVNPRAFCFSATKNGQSSSIDQDGTVLAGTCPALYLNAANPLSYPGTGGTWYDLSGYGNNGSLMNGANYSASSGGVLNFDGVDDYVNSSDNLEWSGALSVESWHKRTAKDSVYADSIVGNWDWKPSVADRRGWVQRYYVDSDVLQFIIEVTNGTSIQELQVGYTTNVGDWYHTVSVFDPSDRTIKLYVNGVLKDTGTALGGYNQVVYNSEFNMQIGYNPVNSGYFKGQIGSVRIYDRTLSANEIDYNYQAQRSRYGL